jgi:hypothetical protein
MRAMVTNWIDIEDDEDIIAEEIEEAIEELEASLAVAARYDAASGVLSAGEEDEEATDDEQDALPSFLEVESNYLSTRRYAESEGLASDDLRMLDRFQARLRRQRLQRLTERNNYARELRSSVIIMLENCALYRLDNNGRELLVVSPRCRDGWIVFY